MEELQDNLELTQDQVKSACKSFYSVFARTMQEDGWFDSVHEQLCDWIQFHIAQARETETDCRLAITMPRGSLKSTIVTKYLAAWLAVNDPNIRILIGTNTHPNARKKLQDIRGLFDSHELFKRLFPELLPSRKNRWTDESAEINRPMVFPESTFEACGVGTVKIGTHYNCIIEDDTLAPDVSEMKLEITTPSLETTEQAIGWHKSANNLLVPKGTRIRIIVSTRWNDYDLIQHVKENENYKFFDMPAIAADGTPNFSMFYSLEKLKDIEKQIGPYMFSCLYLNKPMDASQRKFQREWFSYIDRNSLPEGGYTSIAIDPAISEKQDACETAITQVYHWMTDDKRPQMCWVKDTHAHLDPLQSVRIMLDSAQLCVGKVYLLVETVAYQAALKYILRDEMIRRGVNYDIIEIPSRSSKNIKIEAMIPYFANKRILFLKGALTPEVESQLLQFPHGKLVDVIDSFSMHLKVYKGERATEKLRIKQEDDPFSFETVLKEVHEASMARNFQTKGGLSTGLNGDVNFNILDTGLGLEQNANVFFTQMR